MNTEQDTNKATDTTTGEAPVQVSTAAAANAAFAAPSPTPAGEPPEDDHRKAVNDGRLRKASEELKAEREKNAELQKQIEELRAKAEERDIGVIPGTEGLDDVGQGSLRSAAEWNRKRIMSDVDRRFGELERQYAANAAAALQNSSQKANDEAAAELERSYPGLLARIGTGDLSGAWADFRRGLDGFSGMSRDAILQNAQKRGSGAPIVQLVREFVAERDLARQYQLPAGMPRSAAPATPAGNDARGKTVYPSIEAIQRQIEEVRSQERRGRIDRTTRDKQIAELQDAILEGRFVRQ
jgi:hypothetical protein